MHLTKSDFKTCFSCRTRLYYRKNAYPRSSDENEYLQFLADGGFMVEFLAKARFSGGLDLAGVRDPVAAARRTADRLAAGDGAIFEAAFTHGRCHVRTDILCKTGRILDLIEVKSSAVDDDDNDASSTFLTARGGVQGRWRDYLLDVAFQTQVVRQACPGYEVRPFLCVVNKGHVVTAGETLGRFRLEKDPVDPRARPRVRYVGDAAALEESALLSVRDVSREVALLADEVTARAEVLVALLAANGVQRVQEPIADLYRECRVCEYRTAGPRSGFAECWGPLAEAAPHVLDLHRVGQIARKGKPDPVAALLRAGRAGILDLAEEDLGADNAYAARRRMQWRCLRDGGREHRPDALRTELLAHQTAPGWPLHFIDFEACDIALPHHAGLRPYERVAFQWSCHTVNPAGRVGHDEWLNPGREFPNFAFARTLRERLGETGTVYVWSPYEQVTLLKVLGQIRAWLERDPTAAIHLSGLPDAAALLDLAAWIDRLLGVVGPGGKRASPRIRDLHKIALAHYCHPAMGGRTSIKAVLPAVWHSNERLRANPCFARYLALEAGGRLLDPYESLPSLPFGDDGEDDDAVREGTGAIRVYQDYMFAENAPDAVQEKRRKLLLQYCELDTAAMVMIWSHWLDRFDLVPGGPVVSHA